MKTWSFAQNPILNATNSFSIGMKISTYHDSALGAVTDDPVIKGLHDSYHPIHIDFKTKYDARKTHGNIRQGETLNLTQLLELLSGSKIRLWDNKVQIAYDPSTPEYKKLLPNHRSPFQNGTQLDRIHAVKTFSDAIGTDTTLTAVKTDVDNFYAMLDEAFTTQKGGESTSKTKSDDLETALEAMCVAQYANLGALIQKYAATPEKVEKFFDLATIRQSEQVKFTGHLKAEEVYTVVKHTFGEGDEVRLSNNGPTTLKFYLSNAQDMQPNETAFTLSSGKETVLASSLGKLTDTYLTVFNTSATQSGEFSVEIL